jgi:hypothetical protein
LNRSSISSSSSQEEGEAMGPSIKQNDDWDKSLKTVRTPRKAQEHVA